MQKAEITALFDQQAKTYDAQWDQNAPIRDCLNLLLESMFSELSEDAKILCIGVGTGDELINLASKNPGWRFTAVDPSKGMLNICRKRAEEAGVLSRCTFHEGYLNTLEPIDMFDAATCFLVSQFILNQDDRSDFFSGISERLKSGGLLASSDLASDIETQEHEALFHLWAKIMSSGEVTADSKERMREAYANNVSILSPEKVVSIIRSGGFKNSTQFYQAGLICAWLSIKP